MSFIEGLEHVLNIIGFYKYIQPVMAGFVLSLGVVYIFGRMLDIIKNPRHKNITALITMLIYTPLKVYDLIPEYLNDILITLGWIAVLYTILGMRLFDHLNKLQDKTFGEVIFIDVKTGEERVMKKKAKSKKSK
jgi:multisubunit Na+/H+ antiporter MnhG subunit